MLWVCSVSGVLKLYLKLPFGFCQHFFQISIQSVWLVVPCAMSWFCLLYTCVMIVMVPYTSMESFVFLVIVSCP